jgi:hypothetical protein
MTAAADTAPRVHRPALGRLRFVLRPTSTTIFSNDPVPDGALSRSPAGHDASMSGIAARKCLLGGESDIELTHMSSGNAEKAAVATSATAAFRRR